LTAASAGSGSPWARIRIRQAQLATRKELSDFLAEVERRAYKQALYAVRDPHTALDIVQDAMLKLAEKYGARPAPELPLVFQRIVQNAIRDHFRRARVRSFWTSPLSALKSSGAQDDDSDPLESLHVDLGVKSIAELPAAAFEQAQTVGLIEKALEALPPRQRQAFLLRYWEEMDVAEAAAIMGCSEGSVKTHCSRATHAIAAFLKRKGFQP
jgi:RNA polymerase sigma-70 factor (ECF subfamily)